MCNGDIRAIFEIDLGETIAGVVPESILRSKEKLRLFGLDTQDFKREYYFNSGVMLINLKKWRELDLSQISSFPKGGAADQDFLNYIFHQNITILPFQWNFTWIDERFLDFDKNSLDSADKLKKAQSTYTKEYFTQTFANPKCIHFVIYKPWYRYMIHEYSYIESSKEFIRHPYTKMWFKVAKKTPFYRDIMRFYCKTAVRFFIGFHLASYPRLHRLAKAMKKYVIS